MTDAVQLERLLNAVHKIVDKSVERKYEGSNLLHVIMSPRDMKELRSSFEPFRKQRPAP
jgi:hypothetical protein